MIRKSGLAMGILTLSVMLLMTSASDTPSKDSPLIKEDTGAAERDGEESWTSWAKEKISEGFGLKQRGEEEEKAAINARDKADEVTSDNTRCATEKAGETMDAYKQQPSGAGENAKQAAEQAQENAYDEAKRLKEKVTVAAEGATENVRDETKDTAGKAKDAAGSLTEAAQKAKKETREVAEDAAGRVTEAAEKAANEAKQKAINAGEQLHHAKEKAEAKTQEKAGVAKAKAGESLDSAKEALTSNYDENPQENLLKFVRIPSDDFPNQALIQLSRIRKQRKKKEEQKKMEK